MEHQRSKYLGVTWSPIANSWFANVQHDGAIYHLGNYINDDDAALAYDVAKFGFGLENCRNKAINFWLRPTTGLSPKEIRLLAKKNRRPFVATVAKYVGVTKVNQRWSAKIYHDGRNHLLGRWNTEIEAAIAYDSAALYLKKSNPLFNFPEIADGESPVSLYGRSASSEPSKRTCIKCRSSKTLEFFNIGNQTVCKECYRPPKKADLKNRASRLRANMKRHMDKVNSDPILRSERLARLTAHANNRRARILSVGGSFTASEFAAVCSMARGKCVRCGATRKLTADHVLPITRGGSSNISNIQPLCQRCNSSKSDKYLDYRSWTQDLNDIDL